MKKQITLIIFLLLAFVVYAQQVAFGSIDYVEGKSRVVRSGKALGEANIGDDIFPDDMLKTESDGLIVIALNKNTGLKGTLTIKASSVVYIRFTNNNKQPKTMIELVSGQLGSKISKLSGNPSLQVQGDTVIMGVRGTAFSMSSSITGSTLVVCTDGVVECSDGNDRISLTPGKAVEKKQGEDFKLVPVAISTANEFAQKWMLDDIEAFKANAVKVIADYEKRYLSLYEKFDSAFMPLQRSEILSKWIQEDALGLIPNSNDPTTLKEKKAIAPSILGTRKVLFIFERVYYRITQMSNIVLGSTLEKAEIRPGYSVADFFRRLKADSQNLEKRVILFRYAEKLYELRNQGGAGLPGMSFDDGFFSSGGE